MKKSRKIILASFLTGLLVWIAEAVIDYFIFYEGSFWDLLILGVPEHEIYVRSVVIAAFVGFGILLSITVERLEKLRRDVDESKEGFLTTLKSIGDGVIATDQEGRVSFLNPVAEGLTGWSEDDAVGLPIQAIFKIVNEDSGDEVENPVVRVIREGVVVGLANHTLLIAKDGTRRPIDDSGAAIKDRKGNLTGTVLVFHDISERRQIEKRIAHLNSILRAIRNVNQLITREKDRDKLVQQACLELIETRGYKSAWMTVCDESGAHMVCAAAGLEGRFEAFSEQLKTGWLPTCCQLAREKAGPVVIVSQPETCTGCGLELKRNDYAVICIALKHNGKLYGFLTVSLPVGLVNQAEELVLFEEVSNDLAFALYSLDLERRRELAAEAALVERERLQVTLESIGDAVIATDSQGNITILNSVAEQFTGWSASAAIGKPLDRVFNIVNEITRQPCENPVDKVLDSNRIVGLANHTLLIARDGTERIIADSGSPIRDRSGKVIGVVLVFRDITETLRLRQIANRAQRLETAGKIAGQIAHDFNNLLGPLVAYPGMLREDLEGNSEVWSLLDDMENAALRISDINQQLLTLGRRGHYNQEPMNLNRVVRQVLESIQPTSRSLTIRADLAEDLMNFRGGPAQILRVVSNLVTNALEAMSDTGVLSVRTENFYVDETTGQYGRVPAGEYVKLTVADSGAGISNEVLPRMFDPFFTTKTSDKIRGSGLGLSVVHGVVEDHDGHIDVDTNSGQGSSFYIYFPVCRDTIEEPVPDEIVGGEEKILVVDDDAVQREVSSRLLQKLGYQVSIVASGETAVRFVKDSPADLLILDMVMPPGIDGTETYEQVLAINPSQKAIIVSGFAENERVELALKMGAGQFVRKPLTLKSLAAAVRSELDRVTKT